jgi:hypothetical protein
MLCCWVQLAAITGVAKTFGLTHLTEHIPAGDLSSAPAMVDRISLLMMRSPKPPIACRVVEIDGGSVRRTAMVLFDRLQGWYIDDGVRVEVRSSDESVLFDSEGNLQRVGPRVGGVHSNGWVKTPIEPRRMSLYRAPGGCYAATRWMNDPHCASKLWGFGKARMSPSRCRSLSQLAW